MKTPVNSATVFGFVDSNLPIVKDVAVEADASSMLRLLPEMEQEAIISPVTEHEVDPDNALGIVTTILLIVTEEGLDLVTLKEDCVV